MGWIFGICVLFAACGGIWGVSARLRGAVLAGAWLAVWIVVLMPPADPAQVKQWLVISGGLLIGAGYSHIVRIIRRRTKMAVSPPAQPFFGEAELDRYSRHIMLREIGGPGQKALKQARVLVIGAGGLGSPLLLYLAASGVGHIGVIDDDAVENSNLQRQIIHQDQDIGTPKVLSALRAVNALNPFVELVPHHMRLTPENAGHIFANYDLVLDGSDNFDTRELVNRQAVLRGLPLIAGSIAQWEGQLSLYHPKSHAPCYSCIFPTRPAAGLVPSCAEAGVAAPLPGVIGTMMALEAIKLITGAGETLAGRLLIYDGLHGQTRLIKIKPRAGCVVCGGG